MVYCWGSINEPQFCSTLMKMGMEYVTYNRKMNDYHADAGFAEEFLHFLHSSRCGVVFSYDYYPMLSMICSINRIPYISWIYDCPQYTVLSETICSPYNFVFCFDRAFTDRIRKLGAQHCYHLPLAPGYHMDESIWDNAAMQQEYASEVSFVGSLYQQNPMAAISDYSRGFLEGLLQAQKTVYGYNFLREVLDAEEHRKIVNELVSAEKLCLGKGYRRDDVQMVADYLGKRITARERAEGIKLLAREHTVDLYTSSTFPEDFRSLPVRNCGYADAQQQVPFIYHYSKVNLNITLKTIETGIPQRVLDILSCGGFCISNYQTELAEYMEDGKDMVMYVSMEDLADKVSYYLVHEEERQKIAQNGYEKVCRYFALENRIQEMVCRISETLSL